MAKGRRGRVAGSVVINGKVVVPDSMKSTAAKAQEVKATPTESSELSSALPVDITVQAEVSSTSPVEATTKESLSPTALPTVKPTPRTYALRRVHSRLRALRPRTGAGINVPAGKKFRVRPSKTPTKLTPLSLSGKRGRGRPKKVQALETAEDSMTSPVQGALGRPKKGIARVIKKASTSPIKGHETVSSEHETVAKPLKRGRGRPPKQKTNGETTNNVAQKPQSPETDSSSDQVSKDANTTLNKKPDPVAADANSAAQIKLPTPDSTENTTGKAEDGSPECFATPAAFKRKASESDDAEETQKALFSMSSHGVVMNTPHLVITEDGSPLKKRRLASPFHEKSTLEMQAVDLAPVIADDVSSQDEIGTFGHAAMQDIEESFV